MSSILKITIRAIAAAERKQQRESKKRQRELERLAKERDKLSALEQARLEVETFENEIELLMSTHKEQIETWDWKTLVASLPPVPPVQQCYNEFKARHRLTITSNDDTSQVIQAAKVMDETKYQADKQTYTTKYAEWEKLTCLARQILEGEKNAYDEALAELTSFNAITGVGSSLKFTIHNPRTIECFFCIEGKQAIPAEVKSLTTSGNVTVKQMPKNRFIEIYQDYICSCILRIAREAFALLPIETILVTALTEILEANTGRTGTRPFLSVVITGETLRTLDFDKLDPSDTVLSLPHRGDLKASRKTGDFTFISPLTISDVPQQPREKASDMNSILVGAQRLRKEIAEECTSLGANSRIILSENGEEER